MPPVEASQVYPADQQLENTPAFVNKKLYNWLRELFGDPPYLNELYQLLQDEQDQIGQSPQQQDPPGSSSGDTDWIYYPKGDAGNSLSEWLSGDDGSGVRGARGGDGQAVTQACSNTSGQVLQHLAASLASPATSEAATGNCTAQWLVGMAQNGTAARGTGSDEAGVYPRGGDGGLPSDPQPGRYDGNFTFIDYDTNGWSESQLQQIYDIIRHSQWNSNIILTALLALIFLVGISGNLLVLTVFARSKVRQASTLFIMALAATDLIICSVILPGVLLKEWAVPFRYDAVCKMWEWLRCTTIPLSSLILVAVAVDRYMLIGRAAVTKPLSNRAAKAILFLAVLVSAGMAVPPSLGVGVYQRNSEPDYDDYYYYYYDYYDDYYEDLAGSIPSPAATSLAPSIVPTSIAPNLFGLNADAQNLSDAVSAEASFLSTQATLNNWTIFSETSFLGLFTLTQDKPNNQTIEPSSSDTGNFTSLPSNHSGVSTTFPETPFQNITTENPFQNITTENPFQNITTSILSGASPNPHPKSRVLAHTQPTSWAPTSMSVSVDDNGVTFKPSSPPSPPYSAETTTGGSDTEPPNEDTSSTPTEFYFGLCWQNDLLVGAAFTEHYWQAVAVLFLLVLINVLVMYALVFRAVFRQSRRWKKKLAPILKKDINRKRQRAGDDFPNTTHDSAVVFSKTSAGGARLGNMSNESENKAHGVYLGPQNEIQSTGDGSSKSVNFQQEKSKEEDRKVKSKYSNKHGTAKEKNEIGANGEEDVTSLDDGHYNDWATKSNFHPRTQQVNVDKTSIFCTGSFTVGRTKHYQSESFHDAYQQSSHVNQGFQQDFDSATNVTTHPATEVERPYRRPSWVKRKLISALHQEQRKVHETAVSKLARRQRAKVKMLDKEYKTGDDEWSSGRNRTEMSTEGASRSRESLCNQYDMEYIQEEQTAQTDTKGASPTPSGKETTGKINKKFENVSGVNQKERMPPACFPSTGQELQSKINSLVPSDSVYLPVKACTWTTEAQTAGTDQEPSPNINAKKQAAQKTVEQEPIDEDEKVEMRDKKSFIISPFDPGLQVGLDEPSTSTYADFSLPNTPDLSENCDHSSIFKRQGKNTKSEKRFASQDILKDLIQRQMQEKGFDTASNIVGPCHSKGLKQLQKQPDPEVILKPQLLRQTSGQPIPSINIPDQAVGQLNPLSSTETESRSCPNKEEKTEESHKSKAPNIQSPKSDNGLRNPPDLTTTASSHKSRYSAVQVKTAKVLLLVTAVYIVSFAPALLMTLGLVPPHRIIFYAYFVHSAANPLIYSFINQNFRKQLAGLFKRKKRR